MLGLALDGSRLEGVVLRRTNGALQKLQKFFRPAHAGSAHRRAGTGRAAKSATSSTPPACASGDCIVGVPLKWVLTAQTELPPLPDADAGQPVAIGSRERFSHRCRDAANRRLRAARWRAAKSSSCSRGIPERARRRAGTGPGGGQTEAGQFCAGHCALQVAGDGSKSGGVLALAIGESNVCLQVTAGGGVAALRALEGAIETEGGQRTLHADLVAREARVTLGQLPGELREQSQTHPRFWPARTGAATGG